MGVFVMMNFYVCFNISHFPFCSEVNTDYYYPYRVFGGQKK